MYIQITEMANTIKNDIILQVNVEHLQVMNNCKATTCSYLYYIIISTSLHPPSKKPRASIIITMAPSGHYLSISSGRTDSRKAGNIKNVDK